MNSRIYASLAALTLALLPQAIVAQDESAFVLSGDLRHRIEQDWDSRTAQGVKRDERTRARVRGRINARVSFGESFIARVRVRTGGEGSQQGSNITFADFDDGRTEELKFIADHYSLAWRGESGGVEAGRMAFPFFTPNEYFWDGDIAPLGVAADVNLPIRGSATLKLIGGGFKLPVGLREYSGQLFAGQAVLESGPVKIAAGLFGFDADAKDSDRLVLLDGNGGRDYTTLALNAQYQWRAGGKPLVLGADVYQNLKDYSNAADPVSLAYEDERTGFVISSAWGDTSAPGHLQVGYRYFRIEKLAMNASYAHDDVARFGNGSQASMTDLKGHDVYANYAITHALTIGVRAMVVKRLSNIEDGKRARLDIVFRL